MSQSAATEGLDKSEAVLYCLQDSLNSAHGMEICNELNSLLVRVEKLDPKFDEDGTYQYHSSVDDFKLIIPEGAIVGDHEIQVAVIRYGPMGPFEYPDGYKPMSPIVWFCSSQEKFEKQLQIVVPHCGSFRNADEDLKQSLFVFLKASHKEYTYNKNGEKVFKFKLIDTQPSFIPDSPYVSLHTDHFCLYCVGVFNREDTERANFCLIQAMPHEAARNSKYTITFCLTLDLPTCRQVSQTKQLSGPKACNSISGMLYIVTMLLINILQLVSEQFTESEYNVIEIQPKVKFTNTKSDELKIKFEQGRCLAARAGWLITLPSQRKVIKLTETKIMT